MTGRARVYIGVVVVAAVAFAVWVARQPDPGSVDKVRDAPHALGSGLPRSVGEPVVTLSTSSGDAFGDPGGTVGVESLLIDRVDLERMRARSLVDGEPVWTYGREDREID